jgi:RimJ/RimL family protein N-acetyltransferase
MDTDTKEAQVLGPRLSWTAARPPARETLRGRYGRVEALDSAHARDLFEASHGVGADPAIWNYLPYGPFRDEASFGAWLAERAASRDPLFFAILDAAGRALGMASYLRMVPADGVIEIGHIWFAPVLQRTRLATEAIYLMARHAFEGLGNRRFEWKCNALNAPSRRAALRFGFTFEGLFRQHMVVKARNRDTAWYAMIDRDWPAIRAAFEAWLDPGNFDAEGRQKHSLAAREAAGPSQIVELT